VKKKSEKKKVAKVAKQYALVCGMNKFKLLTVYDNFEVSLGCEQSLTDKTLIQIVP
jgi:hypothetical protein